MKQISVWLAVVFLAVGPLAAANKLKYKIEYGKLDTAKLSLTSRIKPDYPKTLRAAGVQGDVIVSFSVEGDGSVSSAYGVCPQHPELARLAEEAVIRWKFVGTYSRPGVFTQISASVRIRFILSASAGKSE
jgi:TonB family protein